MTPLKLETCAVSATRRVRRAPKNFLQHSVMRVASIVAGSRVLVALIFSETGSVSYYLPEGEWRNLLTGEIAHGPGWRSEQHSYLSMPLWVHVERGSQWPCLANDVSFAGVTGGLLPISIVVTARRSAALRHGRWFVSQAIK